MLQFIYIWSTWNIYWFIGIRIHCQQIPTNSYSIIFDYSQYSVQHLMNNPEGKKTTIRCYLALTLNPTFWLYGAGPAPISFIGLSLA